MGKRNERKSYKDDDEESVMSARSMENLRYKEKKELLNFLNEQLNRPLVFYSSYYRKHGHNILQRNYKKSSKKKKDEEDEEDEEDENEYFDTEKLSSSSLNKKNDTDPNKANKDANVKPTYRKMCDEETCYFDLKEKAHAFPMKWFESQKTCNDYQQIPRTTKEIDISGDNDRNTNFTIFNRNNLKKGKWEKMDRNLQAKYYIYENPLPDIQNFVMTTVKRNQQYERNIREQIKMLYGDDPTPTEINQLAEKQRRESVEFSNKANQRLKERFLCQLNTRVIIIFLYI